jgi:hypothetical protein
LSPTGRKPRTASAAGPGRPRKARAEKSAKQGKSETNGGINNTPTPLGVGTEIKLNLDPLLIVLLDRIPAKADGWPKEQRLRWFRTFAVNVSEVYDDPAAPIDLEIKLSPQL